MRALVLLALAAAVCSAGFSSLRVLPGGRESGMGNVGAASAVGPQAMVWNPAASAGIGGFAVRAGYVNWLLDTHQQSLFVVREARIFTVGIGLVSFSAGTFEYREDVPTEDPLGLFHPVEMAGHINFARSFGPMVDVGLSGRFYYTKVHEEEAIAPGVDVGVRVRPLTGLVLGASVVDFARTAAYRREVFRVPVRARLGAAYRRELGGGFEASAAADGSWFFYEQRPNVTAGLECGWSGLAFLRAGYEWLEMVGRPAAGLGLRAAGFEFDYSLTLLNDELGPAHRVSLAYGR
ncbi:MAG TPA: PorV/PorQ family protein [candidate division WOR-3 bacterium]|uniref:PorV/PorQ family protein n=1 Tax=candidate division WOR-3 bacterium TaxID=2052148 RepID=A0A7V0XFQ1_UNCW3|nr:PorV/PorQ family protein [candidate division WOR-3 bacterium]